MEQRLDIFCGADKVGTLAYDPDNSHFSLRYDVDWGKIGYPLSPNLPFGTEIDPKSISNFIDNLLPEGEGLEFVSRFFHISKANKFSLISATGSETAGAISFVQENSGLPKTTFREITHEELSDRIKDRSSTPINLWDGTIRLSLSGMQDKLPLVVTDSGYGIGEGEIASTHILKFGKNREQHIVINEYICMQLAQTCGLNTANTEIRRFDGEPVLFVERFDRKPGIEISGKVIVKRLHVIDGCQMLDLSHQYKYERAFGGENHARLGVSYKMLFESLKHCKSLIIAKRSVLQWAIFNLFVSNYDAHGKNISFHMSKTGISVAPAYDIVNVALYQDFAQEYAMAIGDEFKPEDLSAYEMAYFCYLIDIKPRLFVKEAEKIAGLLLDRIEEVCKRVACVGATEEMFISKLRNHIIENTKRILVMLPMVSSAHKSHLKEFIEPSNG